jgi:hypothetical protein
VSLSQSRPATDADSTFGTVQLVSLHNQQCKQLGRGDSTNGRTSLQNIFCRSDFDILYSYRCTPHSHSSSQDVDFCVAMSEETPKTKKSKKDKKVKKEVPKTELASITKDAQLVKTKKKYVDPGLASLFQSSVSNHLSDIV